MFSKIIDQKASKLKFNVDGYLTNDRKRQQSQFQNVPGTAVRRQHVPGTNPIPNPAPNIQSQPIKLPDPQIKSMTVQGKTLQKQTVNIKSGKKQKQIHIYYTEQTAKFKIQIKAIPQNSFQVKRDIEKGLLQIQFKKALKKKSFKEEGNPEIKWMFMNQIKDDKISIVMNNKEYLKNAYKILFEGLINQDQIKGFDQGIKSGGQQKVAVLQQQVVDQDRGDQDVVKFTMPTEQQLNETQKFRKSIKDMKEDEKLYIITDIFKIKKQYEDLDRKKFKCPIFGCQKNQKHYREASQLKTHIKKSHPQLTKHGIQVTEFGTFEYSSKALDLALYLGKIFPGQMKKIIKKMKTRQLGQ